MECPLLVSVRCRLITHREKELGAQRVPHRANTDYCCVEARNDRTLVVADPDSTCTMVRRDRVYTFDRVFNASVSNEDVFAATVAPLIPALMHGYNATCFAYGMTGAGKTYTMVGHEASGVRGLCALCVDQLFCEEARVRRENGGAVMTVHASYLEIYNERVKDLLGKEGVSSHSNRKGLDIIEDSVKGVQVLGLTECLVTTLQDLQNVLLTGTERRTMASTGSNIASSRSHAVLQLVVRVSTAMQTTVGRLMLIDLAGSERATHYASASIGTLDRAKRTIEGANINKSLLALGNCITLLGSTSTNGSSSASGMAFIPYRDSKLTRLLKDSLGGNTRTVMIATVSPSCLCYEETISTLKYATRAKLITKRVYKNRSDSPSNTSDYEAVRASLLNEIASLRTQLSMAHRANYDRSHRIVPSTGGGWVGFKAHNAEAIEKQRRKREDYATLISLKEQLLEAELRHMDTEERQKMTSPGGFRQHPFAVHPHRHTFEDTARTRTTPSPSPPREGVIISQGSWRTSGALQPLLNPTAIGREFLSAVVPPSTSVVFHRPISPKQSQKSECIEFRSSASSFTSDKNKENQKGIQNLYNKIRKDDQKSFFLC